MSSENIEPQILTISDDVCLQSQTDVKVLGITVNYRLTFNEHIRICTLKAARQLNALSRISKYLDTKSKSVLYHSFIASNFNYCPIVWHFCGVVNNNKLEKIQERSLRILFSDYESDVHDLLDSIGGQTLALRRLKFMLLEVYKCIINSERQSWNSHCAEQRGMGWEHFPMLDPIYGILFQMTIVILLILISMNSGHS